MGPGRGGRLVRPGADVPEVDEGVLVADPVGEQGAVVLVGHAGVAQFALVEAGEFGGEAEEVGEVGQLQEVARRGEAVRRAVRLLVLGPRVEALGERAGEAVLVVVEPWQAGTPMVSRSHHIASRRVGSRRFTSRT